MTVMAIRGDVEISTSPFSFARNRWPFEFIVEWFEYVFSQKKKKKWLVCVCQIHTRKKPFFKEYNLPPIVTGIKTSKA